MDDSVKKDIDELFDKIKSSDLYKAYISIQEQLIKNKEIMNLIDEIKRYQKIVVNNKDKIVENELSTLYKKLNSYPIYQSYLEISDELNNELVSIKDIFEKYFETILKI